MSNDTTTILWAAPILPGKEERWRRFCQELMGSRRAECVASRQRLGICGGEAWLVKAGPHDLAVVYMRVAVPDGESSRVRYRVWRQLWEQLQSSERPFDRWCRQQLQEICGPDLMRSLVRKPSERLFRCPEQSERLTEGLTEQSFTRRNA